MTSEFDEFDEFDEIVRSRMRPHPGTTVHAAAALEPLKPGMRRARRHRHLAIGTATIATVALSGAGVLALSATLRSPDTVQTVTLDDDVTLPRPDDDIGTDTSTPASIPDDDLGTPGDDNGNDNNNDNDNDDNDDGETATAPTVPSTVSSGDTAPSATSPPDDTATAAATTAPAPATTTTPDDVPPTTAATATPPTNPPPPTTAPPTTAPRGPEQRTIQSDCGTVTVTHEGNTVTLDSTQPDAGFAVDIKHSGPDEIEVAFDDGDRKCQIHAHPSGGELDVEVENPEG